MAALMTVLGSELRALSTEACRRYPALQRRRRTCNLEDPWRALMRLHTIRIFAMACEVKNDKISVIGLSCLQKLISHDATPHSSLMEILSTLKEEHLPMACVKSVPDIYEAVLDQTSNSIGHVANKGHVAPVLHTILKILPLLHPGGSLTSMWVLLLENLLQYLPASDHLLDNTEDDPKAVGDEVIAHIKLASPRVAKNASNLFAEKLVPVIVDLFLEAPIAVMYELFSDVIQSLGRYMTTRRDDPDGKLWRVAVDGFHHILTDYVKKLNLALGSCYNISISSTIHVWKEVADIYELFLVGYCDRALPSNARSDSIREADGSLEMSVLDFLAERF